MFIYFKVIHTFQSVGAMWESLPSPMREEMEWGTRSKEVWLLRYGDGGGKVRRKKTMKSFLFIKLRGSLRGN